MTMQRINVLQNFALADQIAEVYFIFHKAQLRCEEYLLGDNNTS